MTDERSDWIKGYEAGAKEAAPIAYRKAAEVVRAQKDPPDGKFGPMGIRDGALESAACAIEALAKDD